MEGSQIFSRICLLICASFFLSEAIHKVSDHEKTRTIAECVTLIAKRLFSRGTCAVLMCEDCGEMERELLKLQMTKRTVVISNEPMDIGNQRTPSYVIFGDDLGKIRRKLLERSHKMHVLQFLLVTAAPEDSVLRLSQDLWKNGFLYVTFLMLEDTHAGSVVRPHEKNGEVSLDFVGSCASGKRDLDRIKKYSSRYCPREPCTLKYGAVTDETVNFWRKEDSLRLTERKTFPKSIGFTMLTQFEQTYNVTLDKKPDRNLSWPEAYKRLLSNELDIVSGLAPFGIKHLEDLEIVCWYRFRVLVFAANVQRTSSNEMLQLAMPFHYSVWICVVMLLLLYLLLVFTLQRLSDKGLIRERLTFMQVYEMTMAQSMKFPRKTGLRLVLAMWMMFALYFNIFYNSTFTSSLAGVEVEILLRSLEELSESGQPVGGPAMVRHYFEGENDEAMIDLYNRYKTITADQIIESIFSNQSMTVIQHHTVDRMNWLNRYNRTLRVYTMEKPVLLFPVLFFARKAHPYRSLLRRIVMKYDEMGLIQRWTKQYVIEEDKYLAQQVAGVILTMTHLRNVFELFLICMAFSVLLFLLRVFHVHIFKLPKICKR